METKSQEMLSEMFDLQARLNTLSFAKNNVIVQDPMNPESTKKLDTADFYATLAIADRITDKESGLSYPKVGPNTITNEWLKKFLWALQEEAKELSEELLGKWWSKDTIDMQNVQVEIIDLWHFLISLSQVAGMTAEDVFAIYKAKCSVNVSRMENGYSKATKDEADNRSISGGVVE